MSLTVDSPLLPTSPDVTVPDYASGPYPLGPLPDRLTPSWVTEPRSYRRLWLGIAVLVLVAYSAFVFRYWAGADDGVDQNAYLVGGRLLAEHGTMKYVLPNPYAYVGSMFVRMPDGVYFPKYPMGLPLLYACFFWGFKIAAVLPYLKDHVNPAQAAYWAFLVSPLSAIAAVAGTFFITRRLAGSFPAVMAAILLGTSQLMISLANNPNSHAACTASTVLGMYALICWQQNGGWRKGVLGGFLIGFAFTIRYSEFLLVIPVATACLARMRWSSWRTYVGTFLVAGLVLGAYFFSENLQAKTGSFADKWWHDAGAKTHTVAGTLLLLTAIGCAVAAVLAFTIDDWQALLRNIAPGLAWAVPVGALLVFNLVTMHHATGYDTTNESVAGEAFSWKFFVQHWEKAVRSLYDLDAFFMLPFGIAGILMLFRRSWPIALTLLGWFLPGVLLYMFYYWTMDFDVAYARFFLTFIPAVAIGAAVCFKDGVLGGDNGPRRWASVPLTLAVAAVVAVAAGVSCYRAIHGLRDGTNQISILAPQYTDRLNYAHTGQVLLKNVPAGSMLFVDDSGFITKPLNYVQFLNDWQIIPEDAFSADGLKKIRNFSGRGNRRDHDDDTEEQKANPLQKEQEEYQVSLYHDASKDKPGMPESSAQLTVKQLHALEVAAIDGAIAKHQKVFVLIGAKFAEDHYEMNDRTHWYDAKAKGNVFTRTKPNELFEQNLGLENYRYKVVDKWVDTSNPPDKDANKNDSDFPGGNFGHGMMMMFMNSGVIHIWELVEIEKIEPATRPAGGV
jgi:4-amino-4-deoxy-L-arabinose transferase-like glycosyltransferase